jgi:phosphopantothenoylcysteine decarboxylase
MIAVPCLKMDLVRHPAFARSIALLREYGVRVLHEPERYKSPLIVPWDEILATLHEVTEI